MRVVLRNMEYFLAAACIAICMVTDGSSLPVSGYLPSVDRFSTHDGEIRAVPDVEGRCSSESKIVAISFIALPRNGNESIELRVDRTDSNVTHNISLRGATKSFGEFGYNLSLSVEEQVPFTSGDNLTIWHPSSTSSQLSLLHQLRNESRNICWRTTNNPENISCEPDYDYPLLAIETSMFVLAHNNNCSHNDIVTHTKMLKAVLMVC